MNLASAKRRLPTAVAVVVVCLGSEVVGVGAIKRSHPTQAANVAEDSRFPFDRNMLELGYVAVDNAHQGQKLSGKIVIELLTDVPGVPLFATTFCERNEKDPYEAWLPAKGQ